MGLTSLESVLRAMGKPAANQIQVKLFWTSSGRSNRLSGGRVGLKNNTISRQSAAGTDQYRVAVEIRGEKELGCEKQ